MTRNAVPGMARAATLRLGILVVAALAAAVPAAAARAATLQITGPAGATVKINGRALGMLPLDAPLELPRGTYTITAETRGHRDFEDTVVLGEDDAWSHLRIRPARLERRAVVLDNLLLAGSGQRAMGHAWRGWLYTALEAGGLLTAIAGEVQRTDYRDDYELYASAYEEAISPAEIAHYRGLAQQSYRDLEDATDRRDTGLLIAGGAVVASMLDALIFFPGAAAGPGPVPPSPTAAGDGAADDLRAAHVGWKVAF